LSAVPTGLAYHGASALTGDEPGAWQRYQRFTIHAETE
jgi:hypothetical protein